MASYSIFHNEVDEGGGVADYTVTSSNLTGAGTIGNPWIVAAGDDVDFSCNFAAAGSTVFGLNSGIWGQTSLTLNLFNPPNLTVASGLNLTDSISYETVTYYVRREGATDTTPDQFSVGADVTNAALSSNTFRSFTVTGVNADITAVATETGTGVCKVGPTASGPWLDSVGGIGNNEVVYCRFTAPTGNSSTSTYTVTIGSVSDSMSITTVAASDGTPNAFTFTDVSNRELNQTQTSNLITISGINISVAVSVSGGTYSKNGGSYTSSAGTAVNGDTFRVRHTSSSSYSTAVNTTLTVGGVSDVFTSTTRAIDDDPNSFSLGGNQSDLGRNATVPMSTWTVAGMDTGATITVTGSGSASTQVSKNGVNYFTSLTGIANGDTIYSRGTTSSSYSTAVTATVTANTAQTSVSLTTEADPTAGPDEIAFPITTGTIKMSDINDFFAGTGTSAPHNLGAYYRGGTYVPNIGTNSGIPTSGAIAFSDFYSSATVFSFVVDPSIKSSTNSQPAPGSTTISVAWSALSDWEVGPNGALNIGATEYRYRNFVITQNLNGSQVPSVTAGTTTYSTANTLFRIGMTTVNNQEDFAYGTMVIDARSVEDNTKVASKTVQWSLFVDSTN